MLKSCTHKAGCKGENRTENAKIEMVGEFRSCVVVTGSRAIVNGCEWDMLGVGQRKNLNGTKTSLLWTVGINRFRNSVI